MPFELLRKHRGNSPAGRNQHPHSITAHTYQNALPGFKAPEGALGVDLVGELSFHEDALPVFLQHGHPDGAAAEGHRDLEQSGGESSRAGKVVAGVLQGGRERRFPRRLTSHCRRTRTSPEVIRLSE